MAHAIFANVHSAQKIDVFPLFEGAFAASNNVWGCRAMSQVSVCVDKCEQLRFMQNCRRNGVDDAKQLHVE